MTSKDLPALSARSAEQLARAEATILGHREVLLPLVQAFADRGERLYLVGGPVRDALMGRLGHDLDFTTSARPEVTLDLIGPMASATWETGIEFGTVAAQVRGQQVEITTFRSDTYDGVTRNPEVRFGDTLEGDLVRRDFRVNAMAVELVVDADGSGDQAQLGLRFHDPLGGLSDLIRGVIDTPAAPEQSFGDDPLRMLRAARFKAQLGFEVAPRVRAAMTEMAAHIDRITVERVRAELDKMMASAAPWSGWELLVATGVCDRVVPEVSGLHLTPDEHLQHKDVYQHSMTVLRQAMEQEETPEADLVLRWAALLHDCGKPATRAAKPGGGVSFHQHEVVGAKLARKRMRKLKYPKQFIADVSQLIFLHMRFYGFSDGQWTDSAVRRYVTDAGELLPRLHKLVRADCTTRNKRKAARLRAGYDRLEERIEEIQRREDLARVRPDLDGNEIMQILGLKPGPQVGRAWAFMKDLRLEEGPLDRDEAVARLKAWWEEQE
ncbi:CCA tRNA nucleotidyltransferase [Corynebacterium atypicum]|uniref:CCA tRNA nucleotidyltransferase n=1 Tax=Corynebacterium atypicum TaxID=191610 RepID=UPI00068ED5E1|nr:CCA tRNA nucleotidyltransferase [Corynebacterium atypicum]